MYIVLVGKDTAKIYQNAYVEVIPLLTLARDTLFGITGLIEDNLLLPPLRSLFLSNGLGLVPKINIARSEQSSHTPGGNQKL